MNGKFLRWRQIALYAMPIVILALFYLLSAWTVLCSDDYAGLCSTAANASERLVAVWHGAIAAWHNWSGRVVGDLCWNFFMTVTPRWVFPLANTAVYGLFAWLICRYIDRDRRFNPRLFILVNFTLWFAVPAWGENFLWLTGATIYLWTHTALLAFLFFYARKISSPPFTASLPVALGFFGFAVIAGNCTENASVAGLFFWGMYAARKIYRHEKFTLIEILGALGFIIGFLILALCPGNAVRLGINETVHPDAANAGFFIKYGGRFVDYTYKLLHRGAWLLGVIAWLILELRARQKTIPFLAIALIVAAFAGNYVMLTSPHYPDRAFMIIVVFLLIAALILAKESGLPEMISRHLTILTVAMIVTFGAAFYEAVKDIHRFHKIEKRREIFIARQKNAGVKNIVIPPEYHYPARKDAHNFYDGNDYSSAESAAQYYGVETIKLSPRDD